MRTIDVDPRRLDEAESVTAVRVWGKVVLCVSTDDGVIRPYLLSPELAERTTVEIQRALAQ